MMIRVLAALIFLNGVNVIMLVPSNSNKVPIGIIIKPGEELNFEAIRLSFQLKERVLDIREHRGVEMFTEIVEDGNAVELDRAVCRLLNNGVQALIATTTPFSYRMLLPYSNDYNLPLISPAFPEISPEAVAQHGFSIKPSMTRAVLDLIRYYDWKDIVYLYDSDDGPEKLQQIFLLGYRVLKTRVIGILRVNQSEEANNYMRKLDFSKKYRNFRVILDVKAELARDIIVRHVHDVHVGKTNFHFLITELLLDDFWNQNTPELGSMNVTGFRLVLSKNTAAEHFYSYLRQSIMEKTGRTEPPTSVYYSYDAALVLSAAFDKFYKTSSWLPQSGYQESSPQNSSNARSCLITQSIPTGQEVSNILKQVEVTSGITGKIQFGFTGTRKNYGVEIVESSPTGPLKVALWSDRNGLITIPVAETSSPFVAARVDNRRKFKVTSVLHAPYLMIDTSSNSSALKGNDIYVGLIKDLIELLVKEMDADYEIHLAEDGKYGKHDADKGQWSGMIGELIRGVADIAAADLTISPFRYKAIDFTEPFQMITLSLMMKNPASIAFSSPFFIFSSFAGNVWICILAAVIFIAFLLYIIGRFTGSPDNIQSASTWKKFTVVDSAWFTSGSVLLQSTGIYPRSVSSRILGAAWWCFTLIMLALFIANITCQLHMNRLDTEQSPQLAKLKSLSFESIVAESVVRGWPVIGLIRGGSTERFVRMSNLSMYKDYSKVLDSHPETMVSNSEDGIRRVRQSNGGYGLLMESSTNEYVTNREPCDTVMIHDSTSSSSYGLAVPLRSPLKQELNAALRTIRARGEIGNLHRKWWIEGSPCLEKDFLKKAKESSLGLRSVSGIFYVVLICLSLAAIAASSQYFWGVYKGEKMRRQASFEDMTLGPSSLPLPPPELLSDAPLEEDSGVIDGWAERRLIPTSFGERTSS